MNFTCFISPRAPSLSYPLLDLPRDLHYSGVISIVCRNLRRAISSATPLWPVSLLSHCELPSIARKLCCAVSSNFMVLEYNFFLVCGQSFVTVFIYVPGVGNMVNFINIANLCLFKP